MARASGAEINQQSAASERNLASMDSMMDVDDGAAGGVGTDAGRVSKKSREAAPGPDSSPPQPPQVTVTCDLCIHTLEYIRFKNHGRHCRAITDTAAAG